MPAGAGGAAAPAAKIAPVAARQPHLVRSPNGSRNDEYYWLRDDTRQSPQVLAYLAAENAYARALLAPTQPLQDALYDELLARIKQDDASVPWLEHGWWYYTRYELGGEYPVHARRNGTMSAPEQILLDGNALAAGKSFFQIGDWTVSPDGTLLAYAEDDVGRRQYTLRIKDLASGQLLADSVPNVEPNLVWAGDSRTLLYVEKDPVTLLSVKVRKHRVGSATGAGADAGDADPLVYQERDHSYYLGLAMSKSEQYLFIESQSTLQTEWRYAAAADPQLRFKTVRAREPGHEYQVEHLGDEFILRTNWQAPNFRLVRAPIATVADKGTWTDVLAARDDTFIEDFEVFKDYVAVNERAAGLMTMRVTSWDGRSDYRIAFDEPAYTTELVPTPGLDSGRLRYVYTSLTTPATTYEYDMAAGAAAMSAQDGTAAASTAGTGPGTLLKRQPVLGGFDPAGYVTEYLHAPARDGALVPVSIAYRKGTPRDGSAPLYLNAYGSYGLSSDPEFHINWVSLMDRGIVVAIAHIRGGQELGRAWYDHGKLLHKMNSFTDFIDVTRYLVEHKVAAADKVFAMGGSAGGLLMGVVANLAPQAYRGIIAYVPFVDVVTTMLDQSIPLTSNEYDEWGDPREKVYYDYMLSYSPYDNVRAQPYPAMLVTTGLWDSQVQYFEPAKWVARLRALRTDSNPLLLRVNMEAGHGGKSGRFQRLRETALEYQFVLWQLGITR